MHNLHVLLLIFAQLIINAYNQFNGTHQHEIMP